MKKLLILILLFFTFPVYALSVDKVIWPPDTSMIEEGDPYEAYEIYVLRRIDGNDIPQCIKEFANKNGCFGIMKSYHWSSPVYSYGNVYICSKKGKSQYIIEKRGNIKFANWFLRRKLNIPVYCH